MSMGILTSRSIEKLQTNEDIEQLEYFAQLTALSWLYCSVFPILFRFGVFLCFSQLIFDSSR